MCLAKWNVWLVITLFITIVEKQRTLALTKILKKKQKIKVYCNTLPKSTKSCYIVDYVKNEFQWRPIADRLHCPWCKLRVAFSFCFVHEIDVGTMREIIAFFLDPEDGNIYIGYIMSFITLFVLPIEPAHEIMVLCVLRKLILQTRMRSHPVGLDVWRLVGLFIYFHTVRLWTAKALARQHRCVGSPEPSLLAYVISTIISWAGSYCMPEFMVEIYTIIYTAGKMLSFWSEQIALCP